MASSNALGFCREGDDARHESALPGLRVLRPPPQEVIT